MEKIAMQLVPVVSRLTELTRYESIPEPVRLQARREASALYAQIVKLLALQDERARAACSALVKEIAAVDAGLESAGSDFDAVAEAIRGAERLQFGVEEFFRAQAAT